jgi:hypothetical protein
MEPIAHVVWVGCGLSRCSAASAFRRYNSNIPLPFIELYRREAEKLKPPKPVYVRIKAPPGIGAVQTFSGRHITIGEDRIVEMSEEDANCLIPVGWTLLREPPCLAMHQADVAARTPLRGGLRVRIPFAPAVSPFQRSAADLRAISDPIVVVRAR